MVTLEYLIYAVMALAAVTLGFRFGEGAERAAALTMALGWIVSLLLTRRGLGWLQPQWGVFALDVLGLCIFVVIALRRPAVWTVVLVGFQIAAVISHVDFIIQRGLWPPAYVVLFELCSWGAMLTVLWATFAAWRRQRNA